MHDQKTGEPIARVHVTGDAPFSSNLDGTGQSSITIVVNDADEPWTPEQVDAMFASNARMLVRWWGEHGGAHPDDFPMVAHKIESDDYDRDKGTVTVTAIDVNDFADWRLIDGVGADKNSTLTITNRSPAAAVSATYARMMQWNPDWYLPIDLLPDEAGSFSGSWVFWKGVLISDVLKEIKDRTGVEVYLEPYATSTGGVRFTQRVGAPINTGGVHINIDADENPIAGVHYRRDGVNQVTGVEGIGQGSGEDQQRRSSGGTIIIPIRDTRKTFPDMTGDPLQEAVDTYYGAHIDPAVQWDIGSFTIGDGWTPDMCVPGRVFLLEVHGDPRIPDGVHAVRVVAVSGGNGRQLKPEVQ
ncbi:hypothetical protein [Microbacterium testaceum]|uniref:hypothetical protein n=1 Tax=Microbacterium testaceum TaxID=2033 RepID=UPI00187BE321|nr:hypothetical protein [Microbacterium testaceum]